MINKSRKPKMTRELQFGIEGDENIFSSYSAGHNIEEYEIESRRPFNFSADTNFETHTIVCVRNTQKICYPLGGGRTRVQKITIQCQNGFNCFIGLIENKKYISQYSHYFIIRCGYDLDENENHKIIADHHVVESLNSYHNYNTTLYPKKPMELSLNGLLTFVGGDYGSIEWNVRNDSVKLRIDSKPFHEEAKYKALRAPFDYFQMFGKFPPHIMRLILQYILL